MDGTLATKSDSNYHYHITKECTDYGRRVRKSPSLHGRKSTPIPKFLGTAKGYFVCHITQIFRFMPFLGVRSPCLI